MLNLTFLVAVIIDPTGAYFVLWQKDTSVKAEGNIVIETTENHDIKKVICMHNDEFNELANDDLTTLLNKGGSVGLQLTLYK